MAKEHEAMKQMGIAFAVFRGTIFPIISEAVMRVRITIGPPYFNQVNVPLGLALLAWRKASKRNLRRSLLIPLSGALVTSIDLFLFLRGLWDLTMRNKRPSSCIPGVIVGCG